MQYFLGVDLGSSSIKVALAECETGRSIGVVKEPKEELSIDAPEVGWAEQAPQDWWLHVCNGIAQIKKTYNVSEKSIKGIGIAYQMHGLVVVDALGKPLRKSIIWCDSRAVTVGNTAYEAIGKDTCEKTLLNSPSNFTASKLGWVKANEPEIFDQTHKFMLPGDYIAYRFSGVMNTTISGLSEGIFWDFEADEVSKNILNHFGISERCVPEIAPTFGVQAHVSAIGAKESGLAEGTPILYRAGDQPNNALALNVFQPGEVAATGGTSGVMYAVTDNLSVTECAKVNNFAHVNYAVGTKKRIGKLLCINGAGIQYRWLLNNLSVRSYEEMNTMAEAIEIGSDGICILPFGNGAERMLLNQDVGTRIVNLNLNRHHKGHLCRAALEGIAFSFVYGFEIMQKDGIAPTVIRAGNDNLFQSEIFSKTIATLIQNDIEIYNSTGAVGAARACAMRDGDYTKMTTFVAHDHIMTYTPASDGEAYRAAYHRWKKKLNLIVNQ